MGCIWHDVDPARITTTDFLACIEISKGSKNKYELDKETGTLILDRVLYTSTHYPANYGFIPLTYSEDNDPLDVLVLCSEPIVPLTLVRCYPIGVMMMQDSNRLKILRGMFIRKSRNCPAISWKRCRTFSECTSSSKASRRRCFRSRDVSMPSLSSRKTYRNTTKSLKNKTYDPAQAAGFGILSTKSSLSVLGGKIFTE